MIAVFHPDISDQSPIVVPFWLHFYAKFPWQMIIWMHPDWCRRIILWTDGVGKWRNNPRDKLAGAGTNFMTSLWSVFIVANLSHFLINAICIFIKDYKASATTILSTLWRRQTNERSSALTSFYCRAQNLLVIKRHLYGEGVNSLVQLFQMAFCHLRIMKAFLIFC